MSLSLAQWDVKVGRHLHGIEAGSEMVERHCRQMEFKPDFETLAFEQIEVAEAALTRSLERLQKAKADYQGKPSIA
jgi:hypothetical protein